MEMYSAYLTEIMSVINYMLINYSFFPELR